MKQMWRGFSIVAWALLVAVSTGATAQVRADDGHEVASLAPVTLDFGFHYQKNPIAAHLELVADLETRHYQVYKLSFPSTGDNGQDGNLVTALYYQSKLPGKRKLVLVLPIWGTHTYPPRKITKSLTKYSDGEMNILRILGENFLFNWEGMREIASEQELIAVARDMVKRVQTHVIDIRRAIDWVEARPEIDRKRIGIIGFSLGATVASLVAANEPRIGASVLAMGGANINEMFATCFGRAEEARSLIIGRLGWTADTFGQKLAGPLMPINPASFPDKVDPKRVIIFDAAYDTCIPESGREGLWQAMGKPERISWPYNHKMAFLTMSPLGLNTMRRKIYNFLEEKL